MSTRSNDSNPAAGAVRFTCPRNPEHHEFYLRRSYSESWDVTADGRIAAEPNSNTLDGEGDSAVYCSDCEDEWARTVYDRNRAGANGVDHSRGYDPTRAYFTTPVQALDARPEDDLTEDAGV